MAKTRRRDYRAEYQRRVARGVAKGYSRAIIRGHAPEGVVGIALANKIRVPVGTQIDDITLRNEIPKHNWDLQGDDPKSIKRALRDQGFAEAELREIEYTDQETFVKQMLLYGFTYHEAFDLYFGY